MSDFDILTDLEQVESLNHHLLNCGTVCSDKLSPNYVDCLPPLPSLTDIEPQESPIIDEKSYLDDTCGSIPELECIPQMTELPTFLGHEYESRECTRVLRSNKTRYHPLV